MMKLGYSKLEPLLRERLAVIADHALRDRNPTAHLEKLRDVSQALDREYQALRTTLPARLKHFMQQSSYQKALAFIEDSRLDAGEETNG